MDANSTNSTLHFPVRRDGWDTLDFYLLFFSSMLSTGTFCVVKAIVLLNQSPSSPLAWFMLLHGLVAFGFGLWLVVCNIWQRFSEEYVMPPEARSSSTDIAAFGCPMKKSWDSTRLRSAGQQPPSSRRTASISGSRLDGIARRTPIPSTARFLDELAARCPHLEREGQRMHLRAALGMTTTR